LPKIDVETRSGGIELALPPDGKFTLRATAHRGEVENEFGEPLNVEDQGRGGQITGTTGDGPALTLSTDRGHIVVRKSFGDFDMPRSPQLPKPPKPPLPERSGTSI
jgi:hypothetical protein